jgi:hypothetical protein
MNFAVASSIRWKLSQASIHDDEAQKCEVEISMPSGIDGKKRLVMEKSLRALYPGDVLVKFVKLLYVRW